MKVLDLHGVKHADVNGLVENFVLANEMPVKIITGNSQYMKDAVSEVVKRYELKTTRINLHNLGEVILYD